VRQVQHRQYIVQIGPRLDVIGLPVVKVIVPGLRHYFPDEDGDLVNSFTKLR
jgi:hypothetical protein